MKNQYRGGDCLKREGLEQLIDLREGLGKKEGRWCFSGREVDTPMHIMHKESCDIDNFQEFEQAK